MMSWGPGWKEEHKNSDAAILWLGQMVASVTEFIVLVLIRS